MARTIFAAVLTVLVGAVCARAQDEAQLDTYMEILRSDVRAEKIAIITEVMNFTDEEAARFWPVYRKYEKETRKINDRRIKLIRDYADHYWSITDAKASTLVKRSLDLRLKRTYLMRDYFRDFTRAIGAKQAAKFMQLENQINLLIDLQIAAELPLIE